MSTTPNGLKIPPHSIDAEQSVIGGLLLSGLAQDGSAWDKVASIVSPEDFYRQDHALIFAAMARLVAVNDPIDLTTMVTAITASGHLDKCNGVSYLGTLCKDTPSAANIKAYAQIVRNHAVRRQMIAQCELLIAQSFEHDPSEEATLALVEEGVAAMFKLEQSKTVNDASLVSIKPALKAKLRKIEELNSSGKPAAEMLNGVPTGITELDARWSGLEKGKLYTVAARPGMGKTGFALQVAEHVAHWLPANNVNEFVAVFSLEMDRDELAERLMACAGRADYGHIRQPWTIDGDDWARLGQSTKRLNGSDLFIDDSSDLKPSQIRQRLRKLIHETGKQPGLVVVDYLQLMTGDKKAYGNRETEVSEISQSMKRLAKAFKVPVISLSQLNRGVENRVNKRPVLSDLRETGAIEQDSNNVLFLFRESAYDAECGHDRAELITAKSRGGQVGTDTVNWVGKYQRFENPYYGDDYAAAGSKGGW
jgi:replicative DNA helicase